MWLQRDAADSGGVSRRVQQARLTTGLPDIYSTSQIMQVVSAYCSCGEVDMGIRVFMHAFDMHSSHIVQTN